MDASSGAGAKLAVKFGDVLIPGKTEALKNQYWTIEAYLGQGRRADHVLWVLFVTLLFSLVPLCQTFVWRGWGGKGELPELDTELKCPKLRVKRSCFLVEIIVPIAQSSVGWHYR